MPRKFLVSKEIEFDAGHRVPEHASKCRNPHGHRYRVVVNVEGALQAEGSSDGMVLDFGEIKSLLTERVHDVYDHSFIVKFDDPFANYLMGFSRDNPCKIVLVGFTPTAENLAFAIFEDLAGPIEELGAKLVCVLVWETPTSMAAYPA